MKTRNINSLLFQIFAWIFIVGITGTSIYWNTKYYESSLIISTALIAIIWVGIIFYLFYSWLVPRYLERGRILSFFTLALLAILILPLVRVFFIKLIISDNILNSLTKKESKFFISPMNWFAQSLETFIWGSFGTLVRLSVDWFKNHTEKKDLENKNLRSEITTLKSKLNPHLMFNSLNNIDMLIKKDPEKGSEVLSKFSDILRYVVYDTEKEEVQLSKEIEYLKKYIDLEKIRLIYPENVSFYYETEKDIQIPPMIFFPFIENGFKHSNLNKIENKFNISLLYRDGIINFMCENDVLVKTKNEGVNENGGKGLELAQKRLDLLYPGNHVLSITENENKFQIDLEIRIAND